MVREQTLNSLTLKPEKMRVPDGSRGKAALNVRGSQQMDKRWVPSRTVCMAPHSSLSICRASHAICVAPGSPCTYGCVERGLSAMARLCTPAKHVKAFQDTIAHGSSQLLLIVGHVHYALWDCVPLSCGCLCRLTTHALASSGLLVADTDYRG